MAMTDEELDEEKFIQLLEDKRHRELMSIFRQILQSLNRDCDGGLSLAISNYNKSLGIFLSKIGEVSKPEINIDNSVLGKEVSVLNESAKLIIESQNKIISLLQNKPIRLKVNRNYNNFIDYVTIEYGNVEFKEKNNGINRR